MSQYVCSFCGKHGATPILVANGKCRNSPSGSHAVMARQSSYFCRHCGKRGSTALSVVNGSCRKGPNGKHEVAVTP